VLKNFSSARARIPLEFSFNCQLNTAGQPSVYFRLCSAVCFCLTEAMSKVSLATIVQYCNRELRTAEKLDYDGACNGLQVENRGTVSRIAAAVDAGLATVRLAAEAKADLLIVHHGLFWGASHPWTARRYELLRALLDHNLAVYSSHLPLDSHPRLGNNAQLCAALGLKNLRPFFFDHGQYLGFQAKASLSRAELVRKLERATGTEALLIPGGQETCRQIGVVSGGAGGDLQKAVDEGVDTFITGEGPHWTYALAEELGMNVLYGGHYATETFGVKALAARLSAKFKVPWTFLDHPTGL
jgi:dinuclear metal center YbgI/SA1388 family protein